MIGDVEVAVVEAESHRPGERLARVEEVDRGEDVDDAVRLGGEVVHLLGERFRRHGQLVAVVGDAVVEEDPEPARVEAAARAHQPCGRAGPGAACLRQVEGRAAHDLLPTWNSRRVGASPS